MGEDELIVFAISGVAALVMALVTTASPLHGLFLRHNAGIGLVRLSVGAAVAWIAFVLWHFADPSVRGVYVLFYLVMGYAVTKLFGQFGAKVFGARLRVDVFERRNLAAALFVAAFTLATGMIFGGSLWGEADPDGSDEGGWWIPLGFFLLGWSVMVLTLALFLWREAGRFSVRIRQNRNLDDARTASVYALSAGAILTEAVAGDFFGWTHGLLSVVAIALMLFTHELLAPKSPYARPAEQDRSAAHPAGRLVETLFYVGTAAGFWLFHRMLDGLTRGTGG